MKILNSILGEFLDVEGKKGGTMKSRRSRHHIFKRTRIRALIVWYLILLGGIIVLVWKMPAIVSRL